MSEYSTCSQTKVNFVMNPIKNYLDLFAEIFDESQVKRNLEKMFDVDSLGIFPEHSVIMIKEKLKNSKKTPITLSSLGMRTK